jgi:hypothetical protein
MGVQCKIRHMTGYTNTFWIGGNLLLDLANGNMSQVLMLVFNEDDASTFTREQADQYLALYKPRADRVQKIRWTIEGSKKRRGLFIVKGEQDV